MVIEVKSEIPITIGMRVESEIKSRIKNVVPFAIEMKLRIKF
jgi:CRISPR/Cas system-associated exonuclease Cas4 (RecB family)